MKLFVFNVIFMAVLSVLPFEGHTAASKKDPLSSIVDPQGQISDFEARFELAKLLSRRKEESQEAYRQFEILLKKNFRDLRLILEISRFYITQGEFLEAYNLLDTLVHHRSLQPGYSLKKLKLKTDRKAEASSSSLISSEDEISDEQAILELAKIYSYHENTWNEALHLFHRLLEKKPNDAELLLAIGRLYNQQKKYDVALSFLNYAILIHPNRVDLLIEAAHSETARGHAVQSYEFLLKAISLKESESIWLEIANVLMMAGSYHKVEMIYQQLLEKNPDSIDIRLKLGWTLTSAQRYEEAEGIYRELLFFHPHDSRILEALATLKSLEKDHCVALKYIEILLSVFPDNPSFIQKKAEALFALEDYKQATVEFERLASYSKFTTDAMIGKGKIEKILGKCDPSVESFNKAYESDPKSIPAQFYQAGQDVYKQEFIQDLLEKTHDSKELLEWATLYANQGVIEIELYEAAFDNDPDDIQAQLRLAEAYSTLYQYEAAINIYLSILDSFSENTKIMIEIARVLSWEKNYENSMNEYDQVILLDSSNPVPRREKARVAYWGKYIDISMESYQSLLDPPVDQLLLEALQTYQKENCEESNLLSSFIESLIQSLERGSIYRGYESLSCQLEEVSKGCNDSDPHAIEHLLIKFLPLYRIQKGAFLEKQTKAFDWENYYIHALPIYQELLDQFPGNQEALYSYAQDFCNLGLCRCSRQLYMHLLQMSPNNHLVQMALERNFMFEHPLLQANYFYWTERGSGQFSNSQIARHQFDEIYEWSPSCNEHIRFMQNEWIEYPFFKEKYYPAEGQTIEINRVFTKYIRGLFSINRKNYFQKFRTRYSSLGTLWFNLCDYVNVGIGFEKRNEIYNYFTLKQGTQANVYWTSLKAYSHAWNVITTYRHYDYNDKNTLDHINLYASYTFTEDPTIFKVILDTSYRNAAHLTRLITSPTGKLITIIHPYWTPRNYYSGSITFEFRYNYAWFNYCEGPQRYLDIKLTGETDTAHNPSIQLAIDWKHEFFYHWGIEIIGLYHRSKLWKADGIWTQVYYRF